MVDWSKPNRPVYRFGGDRSAETTNLNAVRKGRLNQQARKAPAGKMIADSFFHLVDPFDLGLYKLSEALPF